MPALSPKQPWIPPFFGLCLVLLALSAVRGWGQVRISEILPEDRTTLADEDGDHNGWIELHNAGTNSVSLLGHGLSDDPARPFRWVFPDVSLPAGARLVVFTSGKDRLLPAGPLTNAPAELNPAQVTGLRWWLDAADTNSLDHSDSSVGEWRDKSGRKPADDLPAPAAPAELGGKVLWLDSARPESMELADGRISRWRDLSGAENDFSQPGGGVQPALGSDADGLPQLSFDGTNDVMIATRTVTVQTLVWVGTETPAAAGSLAPFVGHDSKYDFHRGDGKTLLGAYSGMPAGIVNAAVYLNGQRINPQTTRLPDGRNVLIIVGAGTGTFNNLAADRLLPGRYWNGTVRELIGFNRALSETEALALDRHLRAKWQGPADQIAADFFARQARPAQQPALVWDPLTALPAVRFDGLDDRLNLAEVKQVRSAFLVIRESEWATDAFRPFLGHSSSASLSRGSDRLLLYVGGPSAWLDGAAVNALSTRPPNRRTLLTLMGGTHAVDSLAMDRLLDDRLFEGDVHEIALFDRVLEASERKAIEAHFARKWHLPDRRLHANFSLKQDGEPLLLTSPAGVRLDTVAAASTRPDGAYGRIGDTAAWGWLANPTPGQPNASVAVELGLAPTPVFGPEPGLFATLPTVQLALPTNAPAEARIYFTTDGSEPRTGPDSLWVEDSFPAGTTTLNVNDRDWSWVRTNPVPASGRWALRSGTVSGVHQFLVALPDQSLVTGPDGVITAEVWCDPAAPPRTVMLQFKANGSWNHRAFWGEDLINAGTTGTASRRRLGSLPPAGQWTRLEIPLADLELEESVITDIAFSLFDGRAAFDALGYSQTAPLFYRTPMALRVPTVFRACVAAPGFRPSPSVTASYLTPQAGALPVISLTTDPQHLYDPTTGIYTDGGRINEDGQERLLNYQRNWERPVHAELFEPDGSRGFALNCGLKVHGAFSRNWPQKSLRLHFRNRYGEGVLRYPVFPGLGLEQFESLVLRNSGNDWHRAYLRDDLAHSLAAEVGLEHQASRPAHLFLNGQYWGVQFLREQISNDTIARQQGLSDDDLDMVKNEGEVAAGDLEDYLGLIGLAQTVTTQPERHPELVARINPENYQDWLALEFFSGNDDWPGNNVMAWRSRLPAGKWSWMLQDCDGGFDLAQVAYDKLALSLRDDAPSGLKGRSYLLMRALNSAASFRQQFALRLGDLLNTTLSTAHTTARLEAWVAQLAPAMPSQIARWQGSSVNPPALASIKAWNAKVDEIRQFLQQRPAVFREQVRRFYGLGSDVSLSVAVQPAVQVESVRIGTLEFDAAELPWTAPYFPGLPVEIRVTPKWGYKVIAWSDGAPAANSRTVTPAAAANLVATLGPDPDAVAVPFPAPHPLAASDYEFTQWPASSAAGSYPPAMAFETSSTQDPDLLAVVSGYWTNRYDLTSRTRAFGEGEAGVSFVNTGNPQDNAGYVTGAVLALDATGRKDLRLSWRAGTVLANSRNYGLRVQWRSDTNSAFTDLLNANGTPVEYRRNPVDGHTEDFGPLPLPAQLDNRSLVQLRFRYFAIPTAGDSGPRAQLRLDDIRVTSSPDVITFQLQALANAGGVTLRAQSRAGIACTLWASADLVEWTEVTTATTDATGQAEFAQPTDRSLRFFQVRAR